MAEISAAAPRTATPTPALDRAAAPSPAVALAAALPSEPGPPPAGMSRVATMVREDATQLIRSLRLEYTKAATSGDTAECERLRGEITELKEIVSGLDQRVGADVMVAKLGVDTVQAREEKFDIARSGNKLPATRAGVSTSGKKPMTANAFAETLLAKLYKGETFGPELIKKYQEANGLEQTGRVDSGTLNTMRETVREKWNNFR